MSDKLEFPNDPWRRNWIQLRRRSLGKLLNAGGAAALLPLAELHGEELPTGAATHPRTCSTPSTSSWLLSLNMLFLDPFESARMMDQNVKELHMSYVLLQNY